MKKIVLTVITLLGLFIFPLNAWAASPVLYDLQTWNGTGPAGISFDKNDSEFVKLMYNEQEVDKANYKVEEQQEKFDITLKEEYLKELELTDGDYYFDAYFVKENYEIENINASFDAEQAKITFEQTPFERMSEADFDSVRLTYGNEEIDPSKYTVTKDGTTTTVTFEKDFLQTIQSGENFICYSKYKKYTYFSTLKLNVAIEETPTQEPETESTEPIQQPSESQPSESQPSESQPSESPKTGYEEKAIILPIVLILLATAGCMIALEGTRRKINNKED